MAAGSVQQALQLRDIHLPPAPPWWPPAPGWWVVAALLLFSLLLIVWWSWRAWQRRRRWRALQAALDAIERDLTAGPAPQPVAKLSALLKRIALSRHPRAEVAALNGAQWLSFLDRTGGNGAFTTGPGRVLAEGAYHATLESFDVAGLMHTVRRWVKHNGRRWR
ncbi:MAG: DUF4381 domain-containing protein [Chromatiaceae bacterium]|nr:DUF4381 domain-containing protein [Gammaproteobacteria bacterium]MCB1881413.1 DUF4381 domain-containing protein [Gammaproteobacteria bacterium]MCP5446160.1 DUF4381 domain-containing protein [Chromatiaceae bacterium]